MTIVVFTTCYKLNVNQMCLVIHTECIQLVHASTNKTKVNNSHRFVSIKIYKMGVIFILAARGLFVKKCRYINFEKEHLFEEHIVGCY